MLAFMQKHQNQQLLNLLLKNDGTAFSLLYDQYAPALYGYILQSEVNEEKAETLLLAVFAEIKNKIAEFNPLKITLFAWMFRILKKKLHEDSAHACFHQIR